MKRWWAQLRTVRGQLLLFAVTGVGAIALAVLAVSLRERLFERYVREKYPPLTSTDEKRLRELAGAGLAAERREELLREFAGPEARERAYGGWIASPDLDPDHRLGRRFAEAQGDWLIERLKRTLVAGNRAQRGRAVAWMALLPDRPEALALLDFARTRALRRNEHDLLQQADDVRAKLSPPHAVPGSDPPGSKEE
jgi:hypothetical protein